jgi:hypothetical protein
MSKMVSKPKKINVKGTKNISTGKRASDDKTLVTQKYKEHPRSYRFDPEIIDMLNTTLERVNKVSPKKISANRLLKALICISTELEEDKLLKAVKEVW